MSTPKIPLDDISRNDREYYESEAPEIGRFSGNPVTRSNDDPKKAKETTKRAGIMGQKNRRSNNGGNGDAKTRVNQRDTAQTLHRQAVLLHNKGEYEMALVMYNRAASVCPRESRHAVAAKRTASLISLLMDPSKSLGKTTSGGSSNLAQFQEFPCSEMAVKRAQKIVENSADPISAIDEILKYLDSRKDLHRDRRRSKLVSKSRLTLRQLGSMASVALENLQVAFASENVAESLRIGNELLTIAEPLVDRYRYEVAARHYLAMSHISLKRHDRAIDQVTRMIASAKKSGNLSLRSRSFMTLGRVHLTFRHLDAAAKAWKRLVGDVDDDVVKAWLFHEIGRCYFEMKRYEEALSISNRCLEYATEGNCPKWLMYGQLLSGQALVELGRLGDAVIALKKVRTIADDENDVETRNYVSALIDRITDILKRDLPLDQVTDEGHQKSEPFGHKNIFRATEVPTSNDAKISKSPKQKSENLDTLSRLRDKLSKYRGKNVKSVSNNFSGRRYSKTLTLKRKRKCSLNITKSFVFTPTSDNDANSFDDCLLKGDDITQEEETLTSRTRVIEKSRSVMLLDEISILNKDYIENEKSSEDGKTSNLSARTYVLDNPL